MIFPLARSQERPRVVFVILRVQVVFRRAVVFKTAEKAFHRQGAMNAKKNLPLRLFSVISVHSVTPW